MLNYEKISDERFTDLSTSLVRCRHFTYGNQTSHFQDYYSHTSHTLRYLRRKQIATVVLQL